MVGVKQLLGTLAFVLVSALRADACSCVADESLCDYFNSAPVVLHATVLSRSDQAATDIDPVTYTVDTITLYKSEPTVRYPQEISFTTASNSAMCGIYLEIGEEYLIHLSRSKDGGLTGSLCAGTIIWSSVSDEDIKTIEDGCDDLCEPSCEEFQECLVYKGYEEPVHYCADVCAPGRCDAGETCTLHPRKCVAPCPPTASCTPTEELCDCLEFQECLVHREGYEDEEYYCADVCDPNPCNVDETCELVDVDYVRAPCPPVRQCKRSTDDPCDGACGEFQECRQFLYNGKWYCSDRCHDGACEEGEVCKARKRKWCRGKGTGCPKKLNCLTYE